MRSMTVFNYLLEATLFGSILILLAITVRALFRSRLGSRAIYVAWLLVALRLLLPISLPNPAMDELRPGLSSDAGARPVADQIRRRVIDTGTDVSDLLGGDNALSQFVQRTSGGKTGWTILLLWGAGAAGVGGWLLWRIERFARRTRKNRVYALEGEEMEMYRLLCRRYRVKPVPAYYVDRLPAGSVVGVLHPMIALPLETPKDHLKLLLSHQIGHLKSRDPLWGVVRCLCCAVHWFNPLVWVAAWLSWRDSELACDDRVSARLKMNERLAYAEAIASAGARSGEQMVSADAVGASFTDKHIRQRVTSIIRCMHGTRVGIAVGALIAAAVLVFSFATGETAPLPTIPSVPAVSWAAAAVPLHSDMEAIACARRFLESDFVREDTSALSFTVRAGNGAWQVEARQNAADEPALLVFSADGALLGYDGMHLLKDTAFVSRRYTHRTLTDSVVDYLSAFTTALVPGHEWSRAVALTDARSADARVLAGQLLDLSGRATCEFTMQIEPRVRMLTCIPLTGE